MAIYRFSFDDKYAGHTAVVTNRNTGAPVTGSPITLDAAGDGTLDLPSAMYRAQVDNSIGAFGDGYSVVDGILDIEASLDGDSSGGSLSTAVEDSYFEMTTSFTTPGTLQFDTFPADLAADDSFHYGALTAGYYRLDIELDFAQPAELHAISLEVSVVGRASSVIGPIPIYPDGAGLGHTYAGHIHVPALTGSSIGFIVRETCVDGTASPTAPEITYAYISITRVG